MGFLKRCAVGLAVAVVLCASAMALTPEQRATVKLWQNNPSQPGMVSLASGTTVFWGGRVWILSTGHQYEGATRENRSAWDVRVHILHDSGGTWHRGKLAGWDHGKDLSLVEIAADITKYPIGMGDFSASQQVFQWGWNGTNAQMYRIGSFLYYTRATDGSLGFVFNRPSIPGDSGAGCFQGGLHVGVIQGTDIVDRNAVQGKSFCAHSDTVRKFMTEMLGSDTPAAPATPGPRAELPPRRPEPGLPRTIPDWRPRAVPRAEVPWCPGGS